MNEKTRIVWIDGMPCISLDEQFGPSRPFPFRPGTMINRPKFGVEIHILRPKDYTDLQRSKEKEFFESILKDIDKFFKGE
jgi:hypothetical protein